MDESTLRSFISGQRQGAAAESLRAVLRAASMGYRTAIGFRNLMYNKGLTGTHKAAVPVISVGNITTGGTGKTPIVALVCQVLQDSGCSPGIISRGYRSVGGQANDEKLVLFQLCPDVPHEQHPDRVAAAKRIVRDHPVAALVMDDGFQHRRLHRDFDFVLIDATNPFGYGHLLPRGLLREPLSSLVRADAVLITRSDLVSESGLTAIEATLLRIAPGLDGKILRIAFRTAGLRSITGQKSALSGITGRRVYLMSGIGNPEAFAATARKAGLEIAGTRWFPDHHHYTVDDLRKVVAEARQSGAVQIVTTLKDLVKLPPADEHFLALEIAADFPIPGQRDRFGELIRSAVRRKGA